MTFPALDANAATVLLLTGAEQTALLNAIVSAVQATSTAIQPVSATALPLPAGAATSAKQDAATAAFAQSSGADTWVAVTPSDTADLAAVPKALYIGGAGNIAIRGSDGVSVTFAVTAGQIVPLRARRVMATSTTATGVVALY